MDQADERYNKEASDFGTRPTRLSETIMPHILNLILHMIDKRFIFTDLLFHFISLYPYHVNLHAWILQAFKESKIVEYSIEEPEVSPGKHEITIDNKQHYKFLGKDVDMISLIKLYIENGKVIRHEDWWDKKPPRSRETEKIPMFGRVMEAMRRGTMLATHAMMGFGNDHEKNN
ncbi:hypothetical protein SAY87_006944 [Trapa incisa]|uniref:Uncharacterized protein n=1 Tax=Trapa incisa TaxID=236973 RepID=A0AAN7K222_9MYRT|nr:hypothetical protein SAY87_006944 [Trapa incisa]